MNVRDTDRGASYLLKRAAQLANRVRLSVGVPADAGTYPTGTPVSVVAAAHEFGLGTAPQRSFLRGWFDDKGNRSFDVNLADAAKRSLIDGTSFDNELEALGKRYVEEVRARMDAGIDPALQPRTIAAKRADGSSTPETPLEDTHRLRNAVTFKVER